MLDRKLLREQFEWVVEKLATRGVDREVLENYRRLDSERRELLETARAELAKLAGWTPESIQTCLNKLLETTGQKPGILFSLIRIAVTWAPFSPQLNDTLALIGCERTLARLQSYLESKE